MALAVETSALSRRFGRREAVCGVDLAVPEGAIYGFLGRNGAGKTTTIRMLLGLLLPTGGSARLFGRDVRRDRMAAVSLAGALVETPCHYDHLTGRENLAITARLLRADSREIDRVLDIVELSGAAGRRVGGYSLGMRQRLGVARALIGRPRLLILDEPTNGLDPQGIRDMRGLVAALAEGEGVTVFVSSHILAEVEQTATHVGLMHQGRLLLQGRAESLKGGRGRSVAFSVDRPEAVVAMLRPTGLRATRAGPARVSVEGSSFEGGDIAAINFMLVEQGIRVSAIDVREPTLEQLFHDTIEQADLLAAA
ncbi:MAG TPA: ATP-binding cassette domain-containing protein [Allosphingosinicella sp.]|jgi:ABC-2 type transport system ATP-binding protein